MNNVLSTRNLHQKFGGSYSSLVQILVIGLEQVGEKTLENILKVLEKSGSYMNLLKEI